MGQGRFKNGKFDLVVVANFAMSANDWTEWERGLKKASELLFDASEGQMQFGRLYVCDENIGADTAEFILHPSGDPSYGTWGEFGTPGAALHLMPYVRLKPLTVLHEMGHHVWSLGEEYSVTAFHDDIDDTNPSPDRRTIPIVDTGRAVNELSDMSADALLEFGDLIERRAVVANTATTVTVDADFPDLPTNANSPDVWYQAPAECAETAGANFCIMEHSRGAAGEFDAAGNWQTVANPITEYCTAGNHDPDDDTNQEDRNHESCWEQIPERAGFEGLVVPDPAAPGPAAGFAEPDWIMLDKQPRFALALDRSGSMASGHKMADAQHGADFWLEFAAVGSDLLSILWYDHEVGSLLDLTQVDTLASLDPTRAAIGALTPRGSTNIRDGLYGALDQIQSVDTRAAMQVALLLTDGKHNTPPGSAATEVLPDFQEAGVRIYALGVGDANAVDMDVLDQLAADTGGRSFAVGDDQPGDVEAAMIEINAEVRGGIITTTPALFPDSEPGPLDDWAKRHADARPDAKRPPLRELLELLRLRPDALRRRRPHRNVATIPVPVEAKCLRASFSIVHPANRPTWLYLVDPAGTPVDMAAADVHHVASPAPHEFAIVDKPAPGVWLMVLVRPQSGPAYAVRAIAGGENRNLNVFGGASPANPPLAPVPVRASARWLHTLTGLDVRATIVAPSGARTMIALTDAGGAEAESGSYHTLYVPQQSGRHHGWIRIRCGGRARIARPAHLAAHAEDRSLSRAVPAPRFVRVVPFYFDSGSRPKVKDDERAKGLVDRYARPRRRARKLRSAAR